MSRVRINSPLPAAPVVRPFTVTVSWDIDAKAVEDSKRRYEEAEKKRREKKEGAYTGTGTPPPPFYVRLKVSGLDAWYQYHFDASQAIGNYTYSGVNPTAGSQTVTAELWASQGTPGEGDDTLLDRDPIAVTVS